MRSLAIPALLAVLMLTTRPLLSQAQAAQDVSLSTVQKARYEHALQSFRAQRYAAAFGRFADLADAGHLPSAQLALVMHDNGPTLFGSDWSATPGQLQRWNALVINRARNRIVFTDHDRGD